MERKLPKINVSEECAAACENFPDRMQLATCAKACRAYAKGCAAMEQMME